MGRIITIMGIVLLFSGGYLLLNHSNSSAWVSKETMQAASETWIDYSAPSGFDVKFPFEPQQATQTSEDRKTGEKRFYDMYVSEMPGDKVLMVSIITFSEDAHALKDQALMRKIIMEMLERKEDNKLERIDVSTIVGKQAVDFLIRGSQANVEGTVFMDGKKLYLLTEVVDEKDEPVEFAAFRKSFRLRGN